MANNLSLDERMSAAFDKLERERLPERTTTISGNQAKTLNASITELFPCIAYLKNINETNPEKFYEKILNENNRNLDCYLDNNSAKQGEYYILQAPNSELFKEKVKNAIAILKFIKEQSKGKTITKIHWTAKKKPTGIENSHPGDIFIQYNDKKWIGISVKAGDEKSKDPLLNTYVHNVIKYFGESVIEWNKESYNNFYLPIDRVFPIGSFSDYGSPKMRNTLYKFESKHRKEYEKVYDEQLSWIIDKIIKMLLKNEEKTKQWLLEEVAKSKLSVPLITVKAVGENYKEINDIDILKECVQRSKKSSGMEIKKDNRSKQNFNIYLICKSKKTEFNFSVRTNKSGSGHKLGQFTNLSFKFNGLQS